MTSTEKQTLQDHKDWALSNLNDEINVMTDEERRDFWEEPHDCIHEAADGAVPVYNRIILELALDDWELAHTAPDMPAYDGTPTPVNIIAANIYDALNDHLWEWYNEHKNDHVDADGNEA